MWNELLEKQYRYIYALPDILFIVLTQQYAHYNIRAIPVIECSNERVVYYGSMFAVWQKI